MADLKKMITENIVKPCIQQTRTSMVAKVIDVDLYRNRADIEYENPNGQGLIFKERVPIMLGQIGFNAPNVDANDLVSIIFENGSPMRPKIIGRIDESYELNTREKTKHTMQGALVTKKYEYKEYEKKNRINSWIKEDSKASVNNIRFRMFDTEEEYMRIFNKLGYYEEDEIGITHPKLGTTIKIDKNGDINIFTSRNNGIKISTSNNKININSIGEISINCENLNINSKNIKLNGKDV